MRVFFSDLETFERTLPELCMCILVCVPVNGEEFPEGAKRRNRARGDTTWASQLVGTHRKSYESKERRGRDVASSFAQSGRRQSEQRERVYKTAHERKPSVCSEGRGRVKGTSEEVEAEGQPYTRLNNILISISEK